MKKGTMITIKTDAVHQSTQKSLNGLCGIVTSYKNDNEIIVLINNIGSLPFCKDELTVVIKEKTLFDLVHTQYEVADLVNKVHIIDVSEHDTRYRIYHADGYSFTINKELDPSEGADWWTNKPQTDEDGYTYGFNSLWEGFKSLSLDEAIGMIKLIRNDNLHPKHRNQ